MDLRVDVVTGAEVPKYTQEIVHRLPRNLEARTLVSKAYANTQRGIAFRLLDHPLRVRRQRQRGAILHVDTQLLGYVLALPQARPRVITCHDLVPFLPRFDDPSYVSRKRPFDRAYYRMLARGLRRADRVVAVSRFVAGELERFGVDPKRIDVVPMGVDLNVYRVRARKEQVEALRRHALPPDRPIVLFVGSEHPRKNARGLIRAFALAARTTNAILVKVGPPRHPQREDLVALVDSLGLGDRVRFLDRVPEADLPPLYGAAAVLALPSFYEGFGLPLLEAMACGTPVLASDTSSMPEVVGDAGVLVNPENDDEIAGALVRLLTERKLRDDLGARGLARAQSFSWDRTVQGLVETYRRAAAAA